MVTINFNNSVVLQNGFDIYSALTINVDGPLAPYNMSWYLQDANSFFAGVGSNSFNLMLDWMDS
jgi:hypothetical protein